MTYISNDAQQPARIVTIKQVVATQQTPTIDMDSSNVAYSDVYISINRQLWEDDLSPYSIADMNSLYNPPKEEAYVFRKVKLIKK